MKVWRLTASLDEDFETLQLVHFDEDYDRYFKDDIDTIKPIKDHWGKVEVYTLEKGMKSDCPHFWGYSGVPVFSERAVKVLGELISGKVEVLPLVHPQERYYAIHVLNVIEAVDYDKTIVETLKTGLRVGFKEIAFIRNKIEGEHIYRVYLDNRVHPSYVFVSDTFKEVVESNGLMGFDFTEVWDGHC